MKPIFFMLLAYTSLFCEGQKPLQPCCGILSAQPPDKIIVRNNTTGQTFQFKTDALDFGSLKAGDAINYNATTKKIIAIKGVSRSYAISQPNPGAPCCSVTKLSPLPDVPCCGLVGIHNNTNNEDYVIQVNKSVASQVKIGQAVFWLEPPQGFKLKSPDGYQPVDGFAMFKLGTGSNSNFYSYPMGQQGSDKMNEANDDIQGYESVIAKFEIMGNEHVYVKINGRDVLSFGDGGHEVNLSHFLKPGKLNNVTFSFNKGSFSKVEIIGKFPDDEKGISLYSFHPGEKGLAGTFEFLYAGIKNNTKNKNQITAIGSSTEEGYESVIAKFEILGNEHVDVTINGRKVLSFGDGSREVNLGHFLIPGKSNTVGVSFIKGSFSKLELTGKFHGDEKGIPIYSFHPGENGTEGTFEFPYAGIKK